MFRFTAVAVLVLCLSGTAHAQISIDDGSPSDQPNLDAAFEVSSATQGVLLPRLQLKGVDLPAPMKKFTAGMIVYNTATTEGAKGVKPGLYYCDGVRWVAAGGSGVVVPDAQPSKATIEPKETLRGVYQPPMECRTFDIPVPGNIPNDAVVLLTLEHAGENPTCLAIRQIDRERNVVSVNSSQMLPRFASIHWMVVR